MNEESSEKIKYKYHLGGERGDKSIYHPDIDCFLGGIYNFFGTSS